MARLVICVMYSDEALLREIKERLEKRFGKIKDEISYGFSFTTYYEEEMGKNLEKSILAFEKEREEEQQAGIKTYTNRLKDEYRTGGKRRANIDPGYLTKEKLMLASNKKSPYKIGIAENIYAHLTLKFENSKAIATYRTYPDFKTEKVQKFLTKIL